MFDGVCNLCHASVAWVIARDRAEVVRFASLQSAAARELLRGVTVPDSVVLVDDAGVHTRSTAALRIARRLGFPWAVLGWMGVMLPRFLSDAVYDWVARNRYAWFGKQDACLLPTPALAARFLDGSPASSPPRFATTPTTGR
ncbi:MAG: DUF393 domain-containing protein [Bryobacterales bacterium]|nr:DUF393 domain-containing protein [Bryobacterales bacterium]